MFLVFAGLSVVGRIVKQKGDQPGQAGPQAPKWPGPVAGPGVPQWPQRQPQTPPPWPPQQQPPPVPQAQQPPQEPQRIHRWPTEQPSSEGYGSIEGGSMEGTSSEGGGLGSFKAERARFQSESEQFRRGRPETALHHPRSGEPVEQNAEVNPLLQVLASKEGLAQAVLVSEVLGKPRALRRFGNR